MKEIYFAEIVVLWKREIFFNHILRIWTDESEYKDNWYKITNTPNTSNKCHDLT